MADITPNDIINREFRKGLRGYATDEVEDFLREVSDRLFHLMDENQRLRAQVDDMRSRVQQYQQTEELLKTTLMHAERTAEDTRIRALQEADLIRREAETSLSAERASMEELRQNRARLFAELRAILYAHLAMLESQEGRASSVASALAE